ncbi:hypothetical protein [Paenibacillus sp. FSL R10-2734]|uniref:hypothetical protein n=1 Tax=Paenibacillus sp. FSL R10-2734 TaxID=2954691 RepID=UPI0030DBD7F3
MTQVKDMTDQQLNVSLAKMCGYEIYAEEFSVKYEVVVRYESPSSFKGLKFFIPCNDAADSLEVEAKALDQNAAAYIHHLDFRVIPSGCRDKWGYDEVKALLTASPRERAEAAYITLSSVKE